MYKFFPLAIFSFYLFLLPGFASAEAVNPEFYTMGKEAFEDRNCKVAINYLTQFKRLNENMISEHEEFFGQIDKKIETCEYILESESAEFRGFGIMGDHFGGVGKHKSIPRYGDFR